METLTDSIFHLNMYNEIFQFCGRLEHYNFQISMGTLPTDAELPEYIQINQNKIHEYGNYLDREILRSLDDLKPNIDSYDEFSALLTYLADLSSLRKQFKNEITVFTNDVKKLY